MCLADPPLCGGELKGGTAATCAHARALCPCRLQTEQCIWIEHSEATGPRRMRLWRRKRHGSAWTSSPWLCMHAPTTVGCAQAAGAHSCRPLLSFVRCCAMHSCGAQLRHAFRLAAPPPVAAASRHSCMTRSCILPQTYGGAHAFERPSWAANRSVCAFMHLACMVCNAYRHSGLPPAYCTAAASLHVLCLQATRRGALSRARPGAT